MELIVEKMEESDWCVDESVGDEDVLVNFLSNEYQQSQTME